MIKKNASWTARDRLQEADRGSVSFPLVGGNKQGAEPRAAHPH